jgi:hypothetical protein
LSETLAIHDLAWSFPGFQTLLRRPPEPSWN